MGILRDLIYSLYSAVSGIDVMSETDKALAALIAAGGGTVLAGILLIWALKKIFEKINFKVLAFCLAVILVLMYSGIAQKGH